MSYEIVIKKQAKKKLMGLPTNLRHRIAEKIHWLGLDPDDIRLDIKRLVGSNQYRLRVGDWRVLYERDDQIKIISIETIKPRGEAYK